MAEDESTTSSHSQPAESRLGPITLDFEYFAQTVACIVFQETLPTLEAKLNQLAIDKAGEGWMGIFMKAHPDTQVARSIEVKRMATGGRRGQQLRQRKQIQDNDLVWTLGDLLSLLTWLASPSAKAATAVRPSSGRKKSKKRTRSSKSESAGSLQLADPDMEVEMAFEKAKHIQALPKWLGAVGLPPTPSKILEELSEYLMLLKVLDCDQATDNQPGLVQSCMDKLISLNEIDKAGPMKHSGSITEFNVSGIDAAENTRVLGTAILLMMYHDAEAMINVLCRDFDEDLSSSYYTFWQSSQVRPVEARGGGTLHTQLQKLLHFVAIHADLIPALKSRTSLARSKFGCLRKDLILAEELFLKEVSTKGGCDPKNFMESFWRKIVDIENVLEVRLRQFCASKLTKNVENLLSELVASPESNKEPTWLALKDVGCSFPSFRGDPRKKRWLVGTNGIAHDDCRESEAEELAVLLRKKAARIFIVGESGTGKTSLALKLAFTQRENWTNQYIFQCTTEDTMTESLRVFAVENQLTASEDLAKHGLVDQTALFQLVTKHLGTTAPSQETSLPWPAFIILDDVVDWKKAREALQAIAPFHPVIVTSCQPPNGEEIGFDKTVELSPLSRQSSYQVFVKGVDVGPKSAKWPTSRAILGPESEEASAAKKRSKDLFAALESFEQFGRFPLVVKTAGHLFRGRSSEEDRTVLEKLKAAEKIKTTELALASEAQSEAFPCRNAIECIVDIAMEIDGSMAKDTLQLLVLVALLANPTVPEWFFEGIPANKDRAVKKRLENLESLGLISLQARHIHMHQLQRQAFIKNHLPSDKKEVQATLKLIMESTESRVKPLTTKRFLALSPDELQQMSATLSRVARALSHPWILNGGESNVIVELKATILLAVVQFHRLALKRCPIFGGLSLANGICQEVEIMATKEVSPASHNIELAAVCYRGLLAAQTSLEEGVAYFAEVSGRVITSPKPKVEGLGRFISEALWFEYCSEIGLDVLIREKKRLSHCMVAVDAVQRLPIDQLGRTWTSLWISFRSTWMFF